MKVLGIDSATPVMSVAIVEDGRVLASAESQIDRRGADLLVVIDQVCRAAGVGARELDAVAIGAGPGSFTGLRIGMATAKGIAFAAGIPLWAVSSLAALAQRAFDEQEIDEIAAVLDARRGEVYIGTYARGPVLVGEERVIAPESLPRFIGDYANAAIHATPRGIEVAKLALAGAHLDITTGGAPTYIRPSEAEVKYPDGVPGALRTRSSAEEGDK